MNAKTRNINIDIIKIIGHHAHGFIHGAISNLLMFFLFSQLALTSCFHIVYCDVCIQVFQFSYSHYVCMIMWAVFVGAMRVPNKDIMLTWNLH